jgi:hypothetical protein
MILICLTILIGGAFALAVYFSEAHSTPPHLRKPKDRPAPPKTPE